MRKLRMKTKYCKPTSADRERQIDALAELFAPALFAANREMILAMAEVSRLIDAPLTKDSRAAEIADLELMQAAVNERLTALKGADYELDD